MENPKPSKGVTIRNRKGETDFRFWRLNCTGPTIIPKANSVASNIATGVERNPGIARGESVIFEGSVPLGGPGVSANPAGKFHPVLAKKVVALVNGSSLDAWAILPNWCRYTKRLLGCCSSGPEISAFSPKSESWLESS